MEPAQYEIMARREERHWWYAGMRRAALALLAHAVGQRAGPLRLLDAGCGTGGTTVHLRRFGEVVGLDLAWEALQPARSRGLDGALVRGSIERLPFRSESFDVVTSFEVVYHLGVGDDRHAFAEFRRVLRRGGYLLLRVPAHDWLRGEHDRLVYTRHRYQPAEVRTKLEGAGFTLERLGWANSLLFPPAAAKRLLERWQHHRGADGEHRDVLGRTSTPPVGAPTASAPTVSTAADGVPMGRVSSLPPASTPVAIAPKGSAARTDVPSAGTKGEGSSARKEDTAGALSGSGGEPDLWQPPELLNALLESLVAVEALALPRGVPLPFGLSVIALARATGS